MNALKTITTYIADLLFPKTCSGCGNINTFLCERCIYKIPPAESPKNAHIHAIFDYHNPIIRDVIWRFKYRNAREIAEILGQFLYDEIIGDIDEGKNIALVPIPLHSKRHRERGYNQSELLAKAVLNCDSEKLFILENNALIRIKETKPQAKKDRRTARFENLHDAFSCPNPLLVQDKAIILIDDVTTTGATLSEARKVLLKAGAKSVRAYAVAH